jgi:thiamine transport system ATP-binding protein
MKPVLQLRGVELRRGDFVLRVPRLLVPAGRVTCLVGPNGVGKTSLLLAAAGLLDLAAGEVRLDGVAFHAGRAPADRAARRRVGLVFQEPYLFSGSLGANLAYPLRLRGAGRGERRRRIAAVLERIGLPGRQRQRAAALSGGQRRLAALGRALLCRPRALLLDEVYAGLDEAACARVDALLEELLADGVALLAATHEPGRPRADAADVIALRVGAAVEDPRPAEV